MALVFGNNRVAGSAINYFSNRWNRNTIIPWCLKLVDNNQYRNDKYHEMYHSISLFMSSLIK
jgi:hypothetical protein